MFEECGRVTRVNDWTSFSFRKEATWKDQSGNWERIQVEVTVSLLREGQSPQSTGRD